ncbi:MAG: hypothetical protein IT343_16830 [Candidatus Melainabacteria bacterium]|jgi:FtsH-binding integral membrane protein|nr:hypothetical protein [Candidatus Melainabacteria bacterium]
MDAVGIILMILGLLANVACGIWMIVIAFQKHIGWGLAVIFLPFGLWIYAISDWKRANKPFLIHIAAVIMIVGGVAMSPTIQKSAAEGGSSSSSLTRDK